MFMYTVSMCVCVCVSVSVCVCLTRVFSLLQPVIIWGQQTWFKVDFLDLTQFGFNFLSELLHHRHRITKWSKQWERTKQNKKFETIFLTLGALWPRGTCGPLLDFMANRIICLLTKMNSRTKICKGSGEFKSIPMFLYQKQDVFPVCLFWFVCLLLLSCSERIILHHKSNYTSENKLYNLKPAKYSHF